MDLGEEASSFHCINTSVNAHFGSRVLLQPLLRTENNPDLIDRHEFHAVDTHVGIRVADWGVIQQYPTLLVETR